MLYYIYNGSELLGFVYKNKTYYYHKNMFGDIIGILDSSYNENNNSKFIGLDLSDYELGGFHIKIGFEYEK